LFEFGYSDELGNDLGLGYRKVVDVPPFFESFHFSGARFDKAKDEFKSINQVELYGRYAFTRLWAASYRLRYSLESSVVLANQFGVEYTSRCQCWAARLEVEDERQSGLHIGLGYRVVGLGDDSVRPFDRRRTGSRGSVLRSF
jgi:hypothetical protein